MNKPKSSWFALLAFCTTTAIISGLALAILFASATFAFAVARTYDNGAGAPPTSQAPATQASPDERTVSGMLTDSRCGARHPMNSGKTPAECVRDCVRKGAAYMLINSDRSYTLSGNQEQFSKLAGQRVTVRGAVQGSTIQVSAIGPEQLRPH